MIFEYRVAAIMLSRLIRGATVPVGISSPSSASASSSAAGYALDEIVAHTLPRGNSPAPRIQFQAKKRIAITAQDREFRRVMAAAVGTYREHADEVQGGRLLLGLAAGESAAAPRDFDDFMHLTEMARAQDEFEAFKLQLRKGATREKRRTLYDNVGGGRSWSCYWRRDGDRSANAPDPGQPARLACPSGRLRQGLESRTGWPVEHSYPDWLGRARPHGTSLQPRRFLDKHGGLVSAFHVQRESPSLFGVDVALPGGSLGPQIPGTNVANYGNGPVFVAESQSFYSPHFSPKPS